ncbi:MAG: T9SS type A sorting domain-containing protein [Ignavibacteriaceae bacterium]|nr:T9SS type A sorting domain-containing protein [Ignavibacteriaceae bacterium]
MKTKINLLIMLLAFIGLSNNLNAQALFKDLNPGATHADPIQFMSVNSTMYFITYTRAPTYIYQLWKSDGTVENTVMIKDNIISGAIKDMVLLRATMNGILYFTVNAAGPTAGGITYLWITDGTTPVLIGTFSYTAVGNPTVFTVIGNKLFFNMGSILYVSDGTEAGTKSLVSVFEGMVAFNGKLYFQGSNAPGLYELYSSDGTAAGTTLVKAGAYKPKNLIVYKNELYFSGGYSNDELWKTDGTASGTVIIAACKFDKAYIFSNQLFFTSSNNLWKSDGTTIGTVLVKSAVGQITGANSNSFYTSKVKILPPPDYMGFDYWRSDGTADGTIQVSTNLGSGTSFVVLNNKMYNTSGATGIWETDGTEAGTTNIITGYTGIPFVFNNMVFFSKTEQATGIELWYYNPGLTSVDERNTNQLPSVYTLQQNYPNPFNPSTSIEFQIPQNRFVTLNIFDLLGKEVATLVNEEKNVGSYSVNFDASHLSSGIYFYELRAGNFIQTKKMLLTK